MTVWRSDREIPSDLFQSAKASDCQATWETVHSPKPNASDRNLFGPFASVYASFSQSFALDALRALGAEVHQVVLDPFSGAGTTLAAANQLGMQAKGLDLSPFSVALSKLRFSPAPNEEDFHACLQSRNTEPDVSFFNAETEALFAPPDLQLITSLLPCNSSTKSRQRIRSIMTEPTVKINEREYVFLCAVIAANKSAKVATGSNPVWVRKLLDGEPSSRTQLEVLIKELWSKFNQIIYNRTASNPEISLADARSMPIDSGSVDIALFSPPYLNRLDYFITNFPANMILCDIAGDNSEKIRQEMIGSTKINQKGASPYPVGEYGRSLLNSVWNHSSKASRTYYYWNFVDYIRATYEVAAELRRVMKPGGRGAIVVQDSFYKDIRVQTHQIICEALSRHGLDCRVVRRQTVKGHMGRINPEQAKYAINKTLYEYVLQFSYI